MEISVRSVRRRRLSRSERSALLITKLWPIYCFEGQKAFQNEYIGMIRVRYINTIIHSINILCRPRSVRRRRLSRSVRLAHSTRPPLIHLPFEWTWRGGGGAGGRPATRACLAAGRPARRRLSLSLRGELENEVFSALALLITKLWTIYCFGGQRGL